MVNQYRVVLRNRRLSFLLFGDFVSKLGDGMLLVALPLLALRIHGGVSPATAISLTLTAPLLISLPLGLRVGLGRLRLDPRTVIVADCLLRTTAMTFLAALAFNRALSLPVLFIVLLLGSSLRAVAGASRRVLATEAVTESQRLGVNSVLGINDSTAVYIVGPSLGGILVVAVDPWLPLLLDGLSLVLLVIAVLAMPRTVGTAAEPAASPRSGWQAMRTAPGLWSLFFVVFAYNMLYGPVEVVLPLFVRDELGSSEAAYGYLLTVLGVGAVAGSFAAGFLGRFQPARVLTLLVLGWGGALALVATAPNVYVAGAGLALGGLLWAPFIPVMYTLVQSRVARSEHQSVLTFWGAGYNIAGPVGVLLGAPLIAFSGVRGAMIVSAVLNAALVLPALVAERRMAPASAQAVPVTEAR